MLESAGCVRAADMDPLRGATGHAIRVIAVLAIAAATLRPEPAESPGRLEYEVKAAFLLNFAKFVDWPDPPATGNTDISICIVGDDPFGNILDQIVEGEAIGKRKITVQRIHAQAPPTARLHSSADRKRTFPRTWPIARPAYSRLVRETVFFAAAG